MAKQDSSPLVAAAGAFADELAAYARLGDLFIKTPLGSVKHLERANQLLSEIAAAEGRLQSAGQDLVKVLTEARGEQESLAKNVVEHVPALQKRNEKLRELMNELTSVAGEVSNLNNAIQSKGNDDSTASQTPTAADALGVSETAMALSARSEALAATAHEAEFEELATQAHSLHQRLQAIGKKLAKTGSN